MDKFLLDIRSPYWWLGVVIVGLTLNVVASFIRDWIDRVRRGAAHRWTSAARKREQDIIESADRIRGDPYSFIYHLNRSIARRVDAVFSLVYAVALFVMGTNCSNS